MGVHSVNCFVGRNNLKAKVSFLLKTGILLQTVERVEINSDHIACLDRRT